MPQISQVGGVGSVMTELLLWDAKGKKWSQKSHMSWNIVVQYGKWIDIFTGVGPGGEIMEK